MSVIIMKHTSIGRRAYAISRVDADKLVAEGKAVQDKVHTGIYEEVTDDERTQGYQTRNMAPLELKVKHKSNFDKKRDKADEA
jgi:hypothetical protein